MTISKHSPLPMAVSAIALAALCAGSAATAQQTTELDLTISVMQDGETPAGFVNRLRMPPLEAIIDSQAVAQAQAEVIVGTVEEVVTISDNASQVATDTIREIISVDGTGGRGVGVGVGGGVGSGGIGSDAGVGVGAGLGAVPPAIVDILEPQLPLNETITETADRLNSVVDNLPGLPGNAQGLGSVTGGGTGGGVMSNAMIDSDVNAAADVIVDNLDVPINETVDNSVNDVVNDANNVPLEDLQELPIDSAIDDSPVDDFQGSDALDAVTDTVPEIPGL